jgi:hypothetical protein
MIYFQEVVMRVPVPEDRSGRAAYLAERTAVLREIQCRNRLGSTARAGCYCASGLRRQAATALGSTQALHVAHKKPPEIAVVGAHGGAGTSTVARLLNATDAGRIWPDSDEQDGTIHVILTARTNAVGLMGASQALAAYFAGGHPEGPCLAGFVLVPDTPGRLPKDLNRRIAILASATMVYRLPWVRSWRLCEITPDQATAERLTPGLLRFAEQAVQAAVPAPREPSACTQRRP